MYSFSSVIPPNPPVGGVTRPNSQEHPPIEIEKLIETVQSSTYTLPILTLHPQTEYPGGIPGPVCLSNSYRNRKNYEYDNPEQRVENLIYAKYS